MRETDAVGVIVFYGFFVFFDVLLLFFFLGAASPSRWSGVLVIAFVAFVVAADIVSTLGRLCGVRAG